MVRVHSRGATFPPKPKASPSAEQALDISELERDVSRAAVVALAGIGYGFHLAQQRIHLFWLEPTSRAHRAMAGHRRRDMHQAALQRQRLVPFRHVLGEVTHQRLGVDLAEQRRRLTHCDGAWPEWLDRQAVTEKFPSARGEALHIGLVELDDFGNEQDLASDAALIDRNLHALINDALVRGVLVDNDEAVLRLCHDISLMHLRARSPKRPRD